MCNTCIVILQNAEILRDWGLVTEAAFGNRPIYSPRRFRFLSPFQHFSRLTREQSFRTRSRSGTPQGAKFAAQAFIYIFPSPCYDRPNSTQAMRRRVCVQDWQRELRMVKAVQKRTQKMAFEPPSRIMKLAGTARYSSRVFMARPAYLSSPYR